MEAKEKLATLKRLAFSRFKSHSDEVPTSSDYSTDPPEPTIYPLKVRKNNIAHENVKHSDNQTKVQVVDKNLSLPRAG